MHSDEYSRELSRIIRALQAGELTPDEFHERTADLRDKEAERWVNRPPEKPTTGR
jgi:hypothetical protein